MIEIPKVKVKDGLSLCMCAVRKHSTDWRIVQSMRTHVFRCICVTNKRMVGEELPIAWSQWNGEVWTYQTDRCCLFCGYFFGCCKCLYYSRRFDQFGVSVARNLNGLTSFLDHFDQLLELYDYDNIYQFFNLECWAVDYFVIFLCEV